MTSLRHWPGLLLLIVLMGCAGQPERPTTQRQALYGLGERAASESVSAPGWQRPITEIVLLLDRPEIEASLGVDTARFRETLTRALLALEPGPQVLNWTPAMAETDVPDNQWRLHSRLLADGPMLTLSDRRLLPYRLELTLYRPGDTQSRWQQTLYGAFDASAL
ncbi:hypothetical protein SAMN05661010_02814 [Modicisalibacter muralis]|uniref:Uncharacterized protein n=1 Tax=Modicisalibacter muralis TaxID=119000 RepID=A0A1G9NPX0_9GAMM|nr:hypothetical protein [Halomonas muralis]SDL88638.1 hypothetical protein SAMN05661010_02814 [Halomonas muralis]